jgi:hypothetical protein
MTRGKTGALQEPLMVKSYRRISTIFDKETVQALDILMQRYNLTDDKNTVGVSETIRRAVVYTEQATRIEGEN